MKILQRCLLLVYIVIHSTFLLSVTESNCCPEKKMVVVIPSYNNQQWYARNLQSVLSQKYTNFRIIYIDDCSSDGTGELVEAYLVDHDLDETTYLIRNKIRRRSLYNMYTMVHLCDDDEIVVTLDGDDWFPDNDVLSRLNVIYSSTEVWLTYGQFQSSSSGARGWAMAMPDDIIINNSFRSRSEIPTHLRTFYAWLFKKIKLEDLLYMGKFYPMAGDTAFMFPMIEMTGERHQFISDIMYIYNDENTISEHYRSRQLQLYLAQLIAHKTCYKRLARKPEPKDKNSIIQSDVIVFAQNPEKLAQLLSSLRTYVSGIENVFVLYQPKSLEEKTDYNALWGLYPEVHFYAINEKRSNFSEIIFWICLSMRNDYILFIKNDEVFQKSLCLGDCINALEDTGAYAFYFRRNAQDGAHMPLIEYKNSMSAWNFSAALDQWSFANSLDCVLHKKENSLSCILQKDYDPTPNGIECVWANEGQLDHVGLCFNESYIVA